MYSRFITIGAYATIGSIRAKDPTQQRFAPELPDV